MILIQSYSEYIAKQGDTWDLISLDHYLDEMMIGNLIEFNPDHADTLVFDGGEILRIPDIQIIENDTLPVWRDA